MDISNSDKITVLLYALDFNFTEIKRKEDEQQNLFEWSTGLLLASFAAIIALSETSSALANAILIKILATSLILFPTILIIYRIVKRTKDSIENAESVEVIEELLHIFDDGVYGDRTPFPQEWRGSLTKLIKNDQLPKNYSIIIAFMASCVIVAIWMLL